MASTALGRDPESPPIRYVLQVDDETRMPRFVPEPPAD
jgi:hypothetical protein